MDRLHHAQEPGCRLSEAPFRGQSGQAGHGQVGHHRVANGPDQLQTLPVPLDGDRGIARLMGRQGQHHQLHARPEFLTEGPVERERLFHQGDASLAVPGERQHLSHVAKREGDEPGHRLLALDERERLLGVGHARQGGVRVPPHGQ